MINVIYYFLTFLMFVDCLLLVVLVLAQLPKKEAGAGMAFGGAATDALFGAGSGNFLTKLTKYVAGVFFGLAMVMALMAAHKPRSEASILAERLTQGSGSMHMTAPAAPETAPAGTPMSSSNQGLNLPPIAPVTSSNAAPATMPAVNTNK